MGWCGCVHKACLFFVNSVLYTIVCMDVTSVKCLLLCCQQLVINTVNTYMQNIYILFYVVIIY